jgi:small multidrug resistance pump
MLYIYLSIAIITEVLGTIALQQCNNFSKIFPSVCVIIFYCLSFYFLSLCLGSMNIAFAYSIWSAFGIILIGVMGYVLFNQKLDLPFVVGTIIILIGTIIICTFSKTITH